MAGPRTITQPFNGSTKWIICGITLFTFLGGLTWNGATAMSEVKANTAKVDKIEASIQSLSKTQLNMELNLVKYFASQGYEYTKQ